MHGTSIVTLAQETLLSSCQEPLFLGSKHVTLMLCGSAHLTR